MEVFFGTDEGVEGRFIEGRFAAVKVAEGRLIEVFEEVVLVVFGWVVIIEGRLALVAFGIVVVVAIRGREAVGIGLGIVDVGEGRFAAVAVIVAYVGEGVLRGLGVVFGEGVISFGCVRASSKLGVGEGLDGEAHRGVTK